MRPYSRPIAEIVFSTSWSRCTSHVHVVTSAPELRNSACCPLEFLTISCQQGELRTVARKFACQRQPQTAGAAGYDDYLIQQRVIHRASQQQQASYCAGRPGVFRAVSYFLRFKIRFRRTRDEFSGGARNAIRDTGSPMFFPRYSRKRHSPCADRSARARFADHFRRSRPPAFCHRAGLCFRSRVAHLPLWLGDESTPEKIGGVVLVLAHVFPCSDSGLSIGCEKFGPWVGPAGDEIPNEYGRECSQGHAIAGKSCGNKLMRCHLSDIRQAVWGFEHLPGPAVAWLRAGKVLLLKCCANSRSVSRYLLPGLSCGPRLQ